MLQYYRAIRKASQRIADAANHTTAAFRDHRVEQEPAITDRMLARIEASLDGIEIGGIQWTAKTLTDRGNASQESKYGADFFGVLDIDLPDFKVTKGFLAQAKIAKRFTSAETKDLKQQCEKMLQLSSASFVFLYGKENIHVVPALSVVGSTIQPESLYKRSLQRFFETHLECFIGDRTINSARPKTLADLEEKFYARKGLQISATKPEQSILY
jgi:hypothetical protein